MWGGGGGGARHRADVRLMIVAGLLVLARRPRAIGAWRTPALPSIQNGQILVARVTTGRWRST